MQLLLEGSPVGVTGKADRWLLCTPLSGTGDDDEIVRGTEWHCRLLQCLSLQQQCIL
jgi:hypothetical protein